jgi:hypothetical protein
VGRVWREVRVFDKGMGRCLRFFRLEIISFEEIQGNFTTLSGLVEGCDEDRKRDSGRDSRDDSSSRDSDDAGGTGDGGD